MMEPWRDPSRPVDGLMRRMTVAGKLARSSTAWAEGDSDPAASDGDRPAGGRHQLIEAGLGRLTRVFGAEPVTPGKGLPRPAGMRETVVKANRFGIPATTHEACPSGGVRPARFEVHPYLACLAGRDRRRVVEPGLVQLPVSASSQAVPRVITVNLVGDERVVGHERRVTMGVSIADS